MNERPRGCYSRRGGRNKSCQISGSVPLLRRGSFRMNPGKLSDQEGNLSWIGTHASGRPAGEDAWVPKSFGSKGGRKRVRENLTVNHPLPQVVPTAGGEEGEQHTGDVRTARK